MPCLCAFSMIPTQTNGEKNGSGMSVLLIWLFCFVVDPIAWVCIHRQFLQALPVKPGMRVSSPTPICGIVHSIWLSLTHTASCLRGSHEPVLPPRKETFVTHGPVSHDYTVQSQKGKFDWKIHLQTYLLCSLPGCLCTHTKESKWFQVYSHKEAWM